MLKVGACKCLLKNFQIHKCLKYGKYSTGSDNDQNDNDKFNPKSKDSKTDLTTEDSTSKTLKFLFNNLVINSQKSQKNEKHQRTIEKDRKINNKKIFVFKNDEESRNENTDSNVKELKDIMLKSHWKTAELSERKDNNNPKVNTISNLQQLKKKIFVFKNDEESRNENTDSDVKELKDVMLKSHWKTAEFSERKDNNKKKIFVFKNDEESRNENTDSDVKELKDVMLKSHWKTAELSERKDNNKEDRLRIDFENINKNTRSDLNEKKSLNPISPEIFKNLLSSCKVVTNTVHKKSYPDDDLSVSNYLNSILDVGLIFKNYKMKDDKKPFSIGNQDEKEDFIKFINEMILDDNTESFVKFDSNGKSFISMSVPTMRLNIFRKVDSKTQAEKENNTSIIDLIESHEYRKLNSSIPTSYFHECIQLTRDKIMRNFPIDNEQDSEELNVGFHEHVFPQQYLTGILPNTGLVGQYMNYVCMGLSQNPHLTIEQKKAHIKWYEEYLSNKQEEINLATKKIIDDFEYEKSLRNK